MIEFSEKKLANGLTVLVNRDSGTRMAAVNILYKVGSRDESPERTGFAHLFEHLMFRGTKQVPDFDMPVQLACGENNAFTNNDYTDYYITLPADNVETALWLEADRMTGLDLTEEVFETEKKVVIEEYNQRYLNQPYGDQWLLMRELAYKFHPYRWATIGMTPEHVAAATLDEVRSFYDNFYNPGNAILAVSGDVDPQMIFDSVERRFGPVPDLPVRRSSYLAEPAQEQARRMEVIRNVPAAGITIAFHMASRMERQYYQCDMISDVLAGGNSARLYQRLVKNKRLFSAVNAYITNDIDPGLFVVTGHLYPGVTIAEAEAAIWQELDTLKSEAVSDYEMEKVKNKFEAGIRFGELNVMNKALNLCYYNMLGDMNLLNGEVAMYRSLVAAELMECASAIFRLENSSTLIYLPEKAD